MCGSHRTSTRTCSSLEKIWTLLCSGKTQSKCPSPSLIRMPRSRRVCRHPKKLTRGRMSQLKRNSSNMKPWFLWATPKSQARLETLCSRKTRLDSDPKVRSPTTLRSKRIWGSILLQGEMNQLIFKPAALANPFKRPRVSPTKAAKATTKSVWMPSPITMALISRLRTELSVTKEKPKVPYSIWTFVWQVFLTLTKIACRSQRCPRGKW